MGATGLGQTKVYEILRLVKASAQDSDKPQGAQ
jgi:predicted ATPase